MAQNGQKEKKNCSGSLGSSGGNYFMFFLSNTSSHEALHSHKRSIYFLECEDNLSQSSWNTVTLFDSD